MTDNKDLIDRLRKRAQIRRQASSRKSVQEGVPDRLADLLDEAATALENSQGGCDHRWHFFEAETRARCLKCGMRKPL